MLGKVRKVVHKAITRRYGILDPDEYIFNQRESNVTRKIKEATLAPLYGASKLNRPRRRHE